MSAEADEAAALWGGRVVRPLRIRENAVYEIALPQGRAALRLHRLGYQARAAIESELWWCGELARAGLPVSTPLPSLAGPVLAQLGKGRLASVVAWVAGAPCGLAGVPLAGSVGQQAALHHKLGLLLARMHRVTDALVLPVTFARPAWDAAGLVGEAPFWGRFWEHPALTPREAGVLRAARAWLAIHLEQSRSPLGLIHADVLRENILVADGQLSLIDFDDSGFGYRFYDLGTVLSQNLFEAGYSEIRAALLEGYGAAGAEAEVDGFTLARCLASVGWAAPRLSPDDPVHRSHIARAVMFAERCLG
jgi:Ser/Thr protein kinase RdoA (MazF antagonist)